MSDVEITEDESGIRFTAQLRFPQTTGLIPVVRHESVNVLTAHGLLVTACAVVMCVVLWRSSPWNIRGEWMGLTIDDIRAQRAMLERGEAIREAKQRDADLAALRDQFAMAAMSGLLAAETSGSLTDDIRADYAYKAADAMLARRDR